MKKTQAVILAAGLGTRMKTETPKVLHTLDGETLLGRVMGATKKAGVKEIVGVVGYKAKEIENRYKDQMLFVRQKELLGSGDALTCALGKISKTAKNILVTCGDTPLIKSSTYKALLKKHMKAEASCTILTAKVDDPSFYGRIVRNNKKSIVGITEEKDASPKVKEIKEVNVGTYCFSKEDLKKFSKNIKMNKKKKEFYLTDIVEILAKSGKVIASHTCDSEEMIGINSRKDLAVAYKIINEKTLNNLMASGVTIVDPGTTFINQNVTIGKDTVIYPNTVIEKEVKVGKNCKIGPFARLRPGTKLSDYVDVGNFVELVRTKIGKGTKVKHHTYLGDTTVGKDVNIGAGVIVANYDGKNKHKTVIGDEVFVGIGVRLIAPVKIGRGAIIGAGSVVTKNKNVSAGQTVAGVPAKPLCK